MNEQLGEAWDIHSRIQLYLLDAIEDEALPETGGIKGRSIAAQLAHVHDVRLIWLKEAAPDLHATQTKLGKEGTTAGKPVLRSALESSGAEIGELVAREIEVGRIKGFKPHPAAFVGYLIAHESYHQGDIGVRLTLSGHPLPQKVGYGAWEWGVR